MADFDIYDDLELLHAQEQQKAAEDLQWKEKYEVALGTIEKLQIEKKELNKKIKQLEVNFASLLDTARTEIKRKDNLISELRREKDDICFRRTERPMRKDPVKNSAGNQVRRDEHFNPFVLETPGAVAKVVGRPVDEQPVASGSKQRNESEKAYSRDKEPQNDRERDRSRHRNRDEFGRRDERDFNRKYDRDLSQTGSSDSNRDKPNKDKNIYSRHNNRQEKHSNAIIHQNPSSKLENHTKGRHEAPKKLQKNISNESKTENCVSNDFQKKKTNATEHKENQKNPTLEEEILKDVKEFKKLKLAEDKYPKPVEDPIKVATEKSNQFIDALFDDMLMNDEGNANVLKEVPPTDECNNAKCVAEKGSEEIISKTDENCNVERQLRTPLKQSVNKLFDDLFGPSPAVTANTVRRNSISSVGESSSDAVEIKEKPDEFISTLTSKTFIVADLTVETSSGKVNEGGQTTDMTRVTSLDSKTSPHVKTAKSFKFIELDSSFYSSGEEDANRKENSIQSQSDIESPPFENCGVAIVASDVNLKSIESNCIGQSVESNNNKNIISEIMQNKTSIDRKCDNIVTVDSSKSKDNLTPIDKRNPGDVERGQSRKLPHPEKQKDSQHVHPPTSEKNEKKGDNTRNNTHRHHHSSKHRKSSSSSRSNNSQKSDGSRMDSERHRHHLCKESKQEHRSSNASRNSSSRKCSQSSRRNSKDSRYHSSHESKNKSSTVKRTEKGKNEVDPIEVKKTCSPSSGWFKLNESNTISLVKGPPLEEDNSSDLKLYHDQSISLDCDDISDEENSILIRKESSAESEQNPNDVGNAQHKHQANEDFNRTSGKEEVTSGKHQTENGEKHKAGSRSNVKATEKLEVKDKMAQEQNTLENKEHKSNDNVVEWSKLINDNETEVEATNSESKESCKTRNEEEIEANTGIEADSVGPRIENFKPNDENVRISDWINQSESLKTTIGNDNNAHVEVVEESAKPKIDDQVHSLTDALSPVTESQTDANDKLSEKAEMSTDDVPPISEVEDMSRRKSYDETENVEMFLDLSTITEVNEAIKSMTNERVESNIKNEKSSAVFESIKTPKLTDASTTVVECRIDEKVEPPNLSVTPSKSTNNEQVEPSILQNEKDKCSAYENKTKRASISLDCDDISDEENSILIRKEPSGESEQNPNDVENAQHKHQANEDFNRTSGKEEVTSGKHQTENGEKHKAGSRSNVKATEKLEVKDKMAQEQNTLENKEHKSNDNVVEWSKLINDNETEVEATNSETKESCKTRNEEEIVANTGIETDSVRPRIENFKPNDENVRISDWINQSESLKTTIGNDNNAHVEVVEESAKPKIDDQVHSLTDALSPVTESQTDANDKLGEKAEMSTDDVPSISEVEDMSKRKSYDETENVEMFLDLVSTITEVNEAIKSMTDENSSAVFESIKTPKLTDASTTVVECRIDEKVEPPNLSVTPSKSTNNEQVEPSNLQNEKDKCSAHENKTKRASASRTLLPYVERNRINSPSWSIGTANVSTGRRTKLKTPRKCTDDGTNPFTIITIVSSRYAKSEDGRSTISNKSPQASSPRLRRTQSSSNLASVDEKCEIQAEIPTEGKSESVTSTEKSQLCESDRNKQTLEISAARAVSGGSSCISLPKEDKKIEKPTIEMWEKTTPKHLKINVKKMVATSAGDTANHSKEESLEQGLITSERMSSDAESVPTSVSKKRKRDTVSADSVDDASEGGVFTTSGSIIPHKKRILQNSTTSGESSSTVSCVTKSPVREKKDKQGKKKFSQDSKGSASTNTVSSNTNGINLSTTGSKERHERHTSKFENSDFTAIGHTEFNDSEVSHPEESTAISDKSLKNSPVKTFAGPESIVTSDTKGQQNKNVDIPFTAGESIATSKELIVPSVNTAGIGTESSATNKPSTPPATAITSDSTQASVIDVEYLTTSAKAFPNSPASVVEQHETPVSTSLSIEITEFLVLHSVESTQTSNSKRKYKKRIMQNFMDSDPNASGDHKKAKILQNTCGFDEDEPLVMASNSKNIHHKKRLLQQSIVMECPTIDESRKPDVKSKKRQTKKIVQNSTEKNTQSFTDVMPETETPRRNKKIQNHNSPNFDDKQIVSENVEDSAQHSTTTSGNKKKRNASGACNVFGSDIREPTTYNNNSQDEETLRTSPDFDVSFAKVPATSHSNKKYKKRILQSFTGSNSIEDEASNVQNLQHSTESNKKRNSPDYNAEQSASVVTQVQDPATCHSKQNHKNFVKNDIDSEVKVFPVERKDSVLRDHPLVVSVTKLKSPRKANCTPVVDEIIHQGDKLKGSSSSIDPLLCVRNSLSTSSETEQSGILPEVEIPQGNTPSIYIKRKMKPSKQPSEKRKKQKLSSPFSPNDCDKPSSPMSGSEKKNHATSKRKRSPFHDKPPGATPTYHEIFNDDVFPENQQAALPPEYEDNDDNVQYQEIDDRMRSMFQSPTYSHTNGGCSFELVNSSLKDDNLKENLTVEETLNQSEKSLCDTSTSSRKISVGSNDYVIETVGALTANVFITRKKCKKRPKIA